MSDPMAVATILVAVVTGGVTLWTQRGGARAQRRTAEIAARAQELREFEVLRNSAIAEAKELREEQRELRDELDDLRREIRALRAESGECSLLLSIASGYIKILRPLIPETTKVPPLPDILKINDIGVL